MGVIVGITSALAGVLQSYLLSQVTVRITKIKKGRPLVFVTAKIALLAAIVVFAVTIFRPYIIIGGICFAVGYFAGIAVVLIVANTGGKE